MGKLLLLLLRLFLLSFLFLDGDSRRLSPSQNASQPVEQGDGNQRRVRFPYCMGSLAFVRKV
jgi:hypothetical protein